MTNAFECEASRLALGKLFAGKRRVSAKCLSITASCAGDTVPYWDVVLLRD
jgi:hypothetical protein